MKRLISISAMLGILSGVHCQTFSYPAFMNQVVQNHPIMQQANIEAEIGKAKLRMEKAVMDPYIAINYADKAYNGNTYYDKSNMKLALPTALGMEIFAGYEENLEPLVNPEVSTSGLYKAGVSMPIGSNLLLNERQMAIRQGKLMVNMAEEQKRIIINDLLFRANLAYLNWSLAEAALQVQENALFIAREQLSFVKEVFEQGDAPAIDTVEAFLQVQNRSFSLLETENILNSAQLIISTFLWDEQGNNTTLPAGTQPDALSTLVNRFEPISDSVLIWRENLRQDHPLLTINKLKIEALKIERQTSMSNILPQIQLDYAALTPGVSNRDINAIGLNDRMLNVGLKYPLLQRQSRSEINLINLKARQTEIDLDVKKVDLETELEKVAFNYRINREQAILYGSMTENFNRLLQAERIKFELGESSVFFLNARENKLFDAQEQLLKAQTNQAVSALKIIQTSNREQRYFDLIE
ncbi:MAG: TolC family protein [Salibacteraceae bacterium]